MNEMFNWNPKPGEAIASPLLYVFFVVTIPITLLVYAAWFLWFRFSQKKYGHPGLDDIEMKLLAARSTTATW